MPRALTVICEICSKRAIRQGQEKRLFMAKFPLDEDRCKQWIKAVGNEELIHVPIEKLHTCKYVCGEHFVSKHFNKKKSRLRKSAVPTINLKADPLPDEMLDQFPYHVYGASAWQNRDKRIKYNAEDCDEELQQELELSTDDEAEGVAPPTYSDLEVPRRIRKPIKKISSCQRKIGYLQQGSVKSLSVKSLIKAYLHKQGRKCQGKRWTSLDKAFAIAIYEKFPRIYRHLQQNIPLPSIKTLQSLHQIIEFEPGISKTIMKDLKNKAATLNKKDLLCALLFDDIVLRERIIFNPRTDKVEGFEDLGDSQYRCSDLADRALVFMLQGLHNDLKQPIAYYFVKDLSSQNLANLIINIIRSITETGYTVLTTVCEHGPRNIGSLNLLKESCGLPSELNYFLLDDAKVFIMFDIPHLLTSIRNNFRSSGEIVVDGKKGKWSHLIELEALNNSNLHFKKITAQHVNPKFKSKIQVKLAAELLSNTVAAILKLMSELYGKEVKARELLETAQVIEDFDRLFDCTNGPASTKDIVKHRRENVSKKTNHVELWKHYKKKMSTVQVLKADSFLRLKNARCVQGYITSLSSLEDIWKYVESKRFTYLNLRQLNLEYLRNLFQIISLDSPTNNNLTCHQFTAALKSINLTKLKTPSDCEADQNEVIINFEDFQNVPVIKLSPEKLLEEITQYHEDADIVLQLPDDDNDEDLQLEISILDSFEKPPTVYVAGYLASVVLKNIQWVCENCKISLKIEKPELCSTQIDSYIKLREWWHDKEGLAYPTVNLCRLVDTATSYFDTRIRSILYEKHISNQAVTMLLTEFDNLQWLCHDHKSSLLLALLVRLSNLLIRSECHHMNLLLADAEESTFTK